MKIRTRLTWCYAGGLIVALMILTAGMYYELVVERQTAQQQGRDKEPLRQELLEILGYYCLPSIAFTVALGWIVLRRALAPLDALTQAAERIDLKNLRQKLPCTGSGDEIDRLSVVLNRMTDRLEESMVPMREFTLHASHELKTPLAILQGELELGLKDPALTPTQRETFESALSEIQRLIRIVSALTQLAKADTASAWMDPKPVSLHPLVSELVTDGVLLGQRSQLEIQLSHCEPVTIQGDPNRLRQLLLNLLDNAIRYNHPKGWVKVSLRATGSGAHFQISNSGPGIPPDQLPRVFDRFYRGNLAQTRENEGFGLGLSLCQSIVQAHGGSIRIESSPESGTQVHVHLPEKPSL